MLVIFTDLDGTLLDRNNYSPSAASAALAELRWRGIPLVLATSKTSAEVEPLRALLNTDYPYIVENGAVTHYSPVNTQRLGCAYAEIVHVLEQASQSSGVPVRGFHDMTAEEVAAVTGLDIDTARLAKVREHDEPFVINHTDAAPLLRAIEAFGKQWSRGGRFYHIHDKIDKGQAVRAVTAYFRRRSGLITTVGLGDAPNDISLLAACDRQFVIGSQFAGEMLAAIPTAAVVDTPGPAGWNEAILHLLSQSAAEATNGPGMVTTDDDPTAT